MKSLFSILGLTFLSVILTNCSLSPEKIASRLKPSIVKLSYKNKPGHGTGFFVPGELGVCTVLTAAHVVDEEGKVRLRTEKDGKFWDAATVKIFPRTIDMALVTFKPETEKCNYRALKIGNSDSLRIGSSIFIYGFPRRGGALVPQFVDGKVSALDRLARGYGVSYSTLTVGGMSGAPVVDGRGRVVAVHGMSDVEIVQSLASQQAGLSEDERLLSQQAQESLRAAGVQRLTFSWGIPITFFRESKFYYSQVSGLSLWMLFYGGAVFGGGVVYFGLRYFQAPRVSGERQGDWERQLKNEKRRREEVEGRLSSLESSRAQARQELERQIEWERGKRREFEALLKNEKRGREEVEGRLSSLESSGAQAQQELERQLEWERGKRREFEALLKNEKRGREEVEGRLSSLESSGAQARQELERQLEWERGKRQELEALLQSQGEVQPRVVEPLSSGDVPLVSAVGVSYSRLRDLLVAKKWREADQETYKRMLEVAGRESEGWFRGSDIENFPCQDLATIDKLWVKYSSGKFGFSVQKQIYQSLGGTNEWDEKVWTAFSDQVGWRKRGRWLNYDEIFDETSHCVGLLPGITHCDLGLTGGPGPFDLIDSLRILKMVAIIFAITIFSRRDL
ncbi:GUN4-like [Trichodesmium erythraeum IMS101]|uniref:GUN4-like n=1 Tax=Trichodesmium erythraeum (strain IMS101) TaxID=203124 RepID=Q111L1_TRIEI|nr:GUN4 domain-containing protein [Trichodesmium erythraeum GBRTRLIN201]